jgi:DNA gyrase subunit B
MAAEKTKKSGGPDSAKATKGAYDASSITVLEGLEAVRRRPGMYIGTTGPDGLHHLIWEIFDNSRDEAMGGFCNDIEVVLLPGEKEGDAAIIRVADNGRGIPVDVHKATKVSALETIMSTLHAGGKFGGEGYKVSGGLHGVGASVVNALSTYMRAEVHRDGGAYYQEYSIGKKKAAVKKVGSSKLHGTVISFVADGSIFSSTEYNFDKIVSHLREQAYLVKGLRITIIDARKSNVKLPKPGEEFFMRDGLSDCPSQTFYFEGGLRSLISFHNRYQKPVHKNIFYVEKDFVPPEGEEHSVAVEIALQYVDDISSRVFPFANNIYNSEGGTHITGFKTALTRTLNAYGRKNNVL